MPANNLPAPAVRAPRLQVLVNGSTAPHPIMAEIVSNNHYAADRFRVTLALNGGPAARNLSTTLIQPGSEFTLGYER